MATNKFANTTNFRYQTLANARLQNSIDTNQFQISDTNFINSYNNAKFVNDYANDIYFGAKDPREEANAYNLATIINQLMPNVSTYSAKKNYRSIIKGATGYDLDAKSILEIFGNKIESGYKSQGLALNQIGYLLTRNGKLNPTDLEKDRAERQEYLSEATKYRRTDYFTEFDSLLERSFLDVADVLPSSTTSIALNILGTTVGATIGFGGLGRILSGVYNGLVEWGNLAVDMALEGADENEQLVFGAIHGVAAGALEYAGNFVESAALEPFAKTIEAFSKKMGRKAVTQLVDKSLREVFKEYKKKYVFGLITEPIEEMLQDASSMIFESLANKVHEAKYGESFKGFTGYTGEDFKKAMIETGRKTFEGQLLFGLAPTAISAVSDATKFKDRNGETFHYGRFRQYFDANKITEATEDSRLELAKNLYTTKDKSFTPKADEKVTIRGRKVNGVFYPIAEDQAKANYIAKTYGDSALNVIDDKAEVTGESVDNNEASRNATFLYDPDKIKVTDDGKIVVPKDNLNQAIKNFVDQHKVEAMKQDGDSIFIQYDGKVQEITTEDIEGTSVNDTDFHKDYVENAKAEDVSQLIEKEKAEKLRQEVVRISRTTNKNKEKAYNQEIAKITTNEEDLSAINKSRTEQYDKYIEAGRNKRAADSLSRVGSLLQAKFANILGEKVSDYVGKVKFELLDNSEAVVDSDTVRGGRITINEDGTKTIYISKFNNETTAVHEIGHAFLSSVSDYSKIDGFTDAYSNELNALKETGDDTDLQEAFARDLEVYIRDGYAKNEGLKRVFDQVIDALRQVFEVYNDLSDEKITLFDNLFESEVEPTEETQTREYNQVYGVKAAQRLAMLGEDTFRLDLLEEAKSMLKDGKNNDEIFKATGWQILPDKKWRYAVQEDIRKLAPLNKIISMFSGENLYKEFTLEDVYKDAIMYKAYPELATVVISSDPSMPSNELGYFFRSSLEGDYAYGELVLNIDEIKKRIENGELDDKAFNKVFFDIIHEIQHSIQEVEGFALGADPDVVDIDIYRGALGELEAKYNEYISREDTEFITFDEWFKKNNKINKIYISFESTDYNTYTEYVYSEDLNGTVGGNTGRDDKGRSNPEGGEKKSYSQRIRRIEAGAKRVAGEKLNQTEIDSLDDETYQREMSIVEIVKNDKPVTNLAKKVLEDYLAKKKYTQANLTQEDYKKMGKTFKKELLKGEYGYSEESLSDPAYLVKRINDYLASSSKERFDLEFVAQFKNDFGNENISTFARKMEKAGLFGEKASNVSPSTKQFSALELIAYRENFGLSISKNLYSLALKEIKNNATFLRRYEAVFDATGKQDMSKMNSIINEELLEERQIDEVNKTINDALADKEIPVEVKKEIRNKTLTKNKVNTLLSTLKSNYSDINELKSRLDSIDKKYQETIKRMEKANDEQKDILRQKISELKGQKRLLTLQLANQKRINAYNAVKLKLNAKIKKFEKLANSSTLDSRLKTNINNIYKALSDGEGAIFDDLTSIVAETPEDKNGNIVKPTFDILYEAKIVDAFGQVLRSFNDLTETEIDAVFNSLNNDIATARQKKAQNRAEKQHINNTVLTNAMNRGEVATGEASPEDIEQITLARDEVNQTIVGKDQSNTSEEKNKGKRPKKVMYEFLTPTRLFDKVDKLLGTNLKSTLYDGVNKNFKGFNKAKDEFLTGKSKRVNNVIKKVLEAYGYKYEEGISNESKNLKAWNKIVEKLLNGQTYVLGEKDYDISQVDVELQDAMKKASKVQNPSQGEYSLSKLIGIYIRAKNPNGISHLSGTNMNISDKQIMWVVNEFENGQFQTEQKIAMALMEEMSSKSKEISDVHYRRTGKELVLEKYYYPNNSNEHKENLEVGLGGNNFRKAVDATFTIEREDDPNTSVNLDVLSTFERDIEKQEFYLTHAEMFDTINDVFYGSREDAGLYDVIASEDKALADTIMDSLASMVYNSTTANTEISGFASRLIANSMAAKISYNISSIFQQPASLFLAAQKYSLPKTLNTFTKVLFNKEYREALWEIAPQIRARSNMNIAVAKEMTKLAKKPIYKPIAKFIDIGMKPMEWTDLMVATALFGVAYDTEMQNTGTSGYGSLASTKATQWVLDVQSSRDAKDSSLAYSRADTFMKVMLMFTNQLNKQYNMVADGIIEKDLKLLMSSLFATTLSSAWVVLATGKYYTGDDDEPYERWLKAIMLENVGMIPVAGEKIQRVIEGYAYQQSDDIVTRAAELFRAYNDDSKLREQKIKTATKNLGVSMFDLAGLPSVEGRRVLNSIKGLTDGYNLGQALMTLISTGYKEMANNL